MRNGLEQPNYKWIEVVVVPFLPHDYTTQTVFCCTKNLRLEYLAPFLIPGQLHGFSVIQHKTLVIPVKSFHSIIFQ